MKRLLLDANILIHSKNAASAEHQRVTSDLIAFAQQGYELVICPQVLRECYAVMTRPASAIGSRPGLGLLPADAKQEVDNFEAIYTLVGDTSACFQEWKTLIAAHAVVGKLTHDTYIAALMKAHSITELYTHNGGDFARFSAFLTVRSNP